MNCAEYPDKHAYLFLVYKKTYVLEKTLQLIDDERNDIYIHVDAKSESFDFEICRQLVKKSKLTFIDRMPCFWASYSLLAAMLSLLKAAGAAFDYKYYHLLSESCMPIKSQDYIHSQMFSGDKDYLETTEITWDTSVWNKFYYFFTETPYYRTSRFVKGISRILFVLLQRICFVDRWRGCHGKTGEKIRPQWGWQWFSLRNETVRMLLSKEDYIKQHFEKTHVPDECCIPTMIYNFGNPEEIAPSKRNILFDGKPSVITLEDYDRLMQSDDFFARKFDENTDREVIDRIFNDLVVGKNDK